MSANRASFARALIVVLAVLCEIGIVCAALALHQNLLLAVLIVPPLLAAMALVRSYRAKGAGSEDDAEPDLGSGGEPENEADDEAEPKALRFLSRPVPRLLGIILGFAIVVIFVILIRWAMQRFVG